MLKRPGREASHSSPSGAEVKFGAAILSLSYMLQWRELGTTSCNLFIV
jgi:hypothetical protein